MKRIFLVFISLVFFLTSICDAHSGGTDSKGGHNGPDGYHYHHGYPAHQHTGGTCPYDFDDRTGERSGTPSSDKNSPSSDKNSSPSKKTTSLGDVLSLATVLLLGVLYFGWIIWGLAKIFIIDPIREIIKSRKRKRE